MLTEGVFLRVVLPGPLAYLFVGCTRFIMSKFYFPPFFRLDVSELLGGIRLDTIIFRALISGGLF